MKDRDDHRIFKVPGGSGAAAHPNSPAGGGGPGSFQQPGPLQGPISGGSVPHPDSPAGRHFYWHDLAATLAQDDKSEIFRRLKPRIRSQAAGAVSRATTEVPERRATTAARVTAGAALKEGTSDSGVPKPPGPTVAPAPASIKGINIEGSEAFKAKVADALKAIKSTKSGEALLADIGKSGKIVTIKETGGGNACQGFTRDAIVKSDGKPGAGSDSIVNFNPSRQKIGNEPWETRPPAVGLAHELVHASHAAHGTVDVKLENNDSRVDPSDPKKFVQEKHEEVRTVGIPPYDKEPYSEKQHSQRVESQADSPAVVLTLRQRRDAIKLLSTSACVAAILPLANLLSSNTAQAMSSSDKNATLQGAIELTGKQLRLSYQFHNATDSDILLFNLLYDDLDANGKYKVDHNLCNIELHESGILISKKIVPVPELMFIETPNIPCVTRIRPRTSFSESVILALPLRPWSPYRSSNGLAKTRDLPCAFEIGYFVAHPDSLRLGVTVSTTIGPALRFSPFSTASQRLLRTDRFPAVPAYTE